MPIQKSMSRPLTQVYQNAFQEWKKDGSEAAKTIILEGLGRLSKLTYRYETNSLGIPLFRVTKEKMLDTPEQRNMSASFSYPSPQKCDEARANKAGCPVFYAAESPLTALKEARPEPRERVYMSKWKVIRPKNALFYLFLTDEFSQSDVWTPILEKRDEFSRETEALSREEEVQLTELHKMYCDTFSSDDYAISSLIGHYLLYDREGKPVDALLYPSQADAFRSCNFAISTRFADTHLSLTEVYSLETNSEEDFNCSKVLERGTLNKEKLIWEPVHDLSMVDLISGT
jgi:hypothetical protein